MPRQPRYNLISVPQHVIQRGNNRQAVFFADEDYRTYLEHLKAAADRHHCDLHAYVLMTNHVHLLATPGTPRPARAAEEAT
ncbi:MAG: transposase [Nitrococcus sp.]|nr:transposase [Nitrococcus sp.]